MFVESVLFVLSPPPAPSTRLLADKSVSTIQACNLALSKSQESQAALGTIWSEVGQMRLRLTLPDFGKFRGDVDPHCPNFARLRPTSTKFATSRPNLGRLRPAMGR